MPEPIREPAVAGRFYPADPRELSRQLARFLATAHPPRPALGVMVPHAGYLYSGAIAGATFARVTVPDRAIVLCPNHTGRGAPRSVWASGTWRLPGGDVAVDAELSERVQVLAGLESDRAAHLLEHAAEVQLPFLRARCPDVKVVPVCLGHLDAAQCVAIGLGLAKAVTESGRDVLLVASSDMSHYVPALVARELDGLALDRVRALDPEGLHRVVEERDLSMCGYIPTVAVMAAVRTLGATRAELVRWGHSGETTGDESQVVGYAGVIFGK